MGYWGNRAKDGDSPLDYFGDFEEKSANKNPNTYLRKRMVKADSYTLYALFGCATLMIEHGYKVEPELLKQIREKLAKASEKDDDDFDEFALCAEDIKFFNTYVNEGKVLTKKPYKVMVEIRVDAIDDESALREAGRWVDNGLSRWAENKSDRVQVKVANA